MNSDNSFGTGMISSLDVLEKTKISRATLNNYIKLGLLPKPVVVKPDDERIKARKVGYFPKGVLDRIKKIKEMKWDGLTMERIAEKLRDEISPDLIDKPLNEILQNEEGRSDKKNGIMDFQKESNGEIKSTGYKSSMDQKSTNILNEISTSILKRKDTLRLLLNDKAAQTHFCLLDARLDNEKRLQTELMSDEYHELLNRIVGAAENLLSQYTGVYGKNYGSRISYYFIRNDHSNYIMDSIIAAFRLKEHMKPISEEWKRKKGWSQELFLNIGIADDYNCLEIKPSLVSFEFYPRGDSADMADKLSFLASRGAVWTTKDVINKLSVEDQKKIRFGIQTPDKDKQTFVEKTFTPLIDRDREMSSSKPFDPVFSMRPITEIIAII